VSDIVRPEVFTTAKFDKIFTSNQPTDTADSPRRFYQYTKYLKEMKVSCHDLIWSNIMEFVCRD
jgi:hypothetical protein